MIFGQLFLFFHRGALLVHCLWLFNSRHPFSQTQRVQTKHVPLRKPVYRQTFRQEVGWGMRVSPTGPEINGCAAKWRKERPQMSHHKEAHSVHVWNCSTWGVCDHERTVCACVFFKYICLCASMCQSLCACVRVCVYVQRPSWRWWTTRTTKTWTRCVPCAVTRFPATTTDC